MRELIAKLVRNGYKQALLCNSWTAESVYEAGLLFSNNIAAMEKIRKLVRYEWKGVKLARAIEAIMGREDVIVGMSCIVGKTVSGRTLVVEIPYDLRGSLVNFEQDGGYCEFTQFDGTSVERLNLSKWAEEFHDEGVEVNLYGATGSIKFIAELTELFGFSPMARWGDIDVEGIVGQIERMDGIRRTYVGTHLYKAFAKAGISCELWKL